MITLLIYLKAITYTLITAKVRKIIDVALLYRKHSFGLKKNDAIRRTF